MTDQADRLQAVNQNYLRDLLGEHALKRVTDADAIMTILGTIEGMEPSEREVVFDALRALFCIHCGGEPGCRCWDDS